MTIILEPVNFRWSSWNLAFKFDSYTVFPHIVSAATILFWIYISWKFHIVSASYVMKTWIVSSLGGKTIQGRKLFKGGNYSREETI